MAVQTDLALIITIVASAFTIAAVVIALFLWVRSEGNADRRSFYDIQREDRKDLLQMSKNIENTVFAIQKEMNDFHRKLEKQDADFKNHLLIYEHKKT